MTRALLTTLMALSLTTTAAAQEEVQRFARGDLDRDGWIGESDLMLFEAWHYGVTPALCLEAMDFDDDGRIELDDHAWMHWIVYFRPMVPTPEQQGLTRGDLDGDGTVDMKDVTALITYLYSGGTFAEPLDAADVDRDGFIDDADWGQLVNSIRAEREAQRREETGGGVEKDDPGSRDGEGSKEKDEQEVEERAQGRYS